MFKCSKHSFAKCTEKNPEQMEKWVLMMSGIRCTAGKVERYRMTACHRAGMFLCSISKEATTKRAYGDDVLRHTSTQTRSTPDEVLELVSRSFNSCNEECPCVQLGFICTDACTCKHCDICEELTGYGKADPNNDFVWWVRVTVFLDLSETKGKIFNARSATVANSSNVEFSPARFDSWFPRLYGN